MLYSPPSDAPRKTRSGLRIDPVQTAWKWLVAIHRRRAQRIALLNLMRFDAALLADLGIERQDVVDALSSRDAALLLDLRRRRRVEGGYRT